MASIRGVMFDAGGVLTRPVGGRWNPRHDFEGILLAHHPDVNTTLFPAAFAAGQDFLDTAPATAQRADYHRVILRALGIAEPQPILLDALQAPAAGPVIELYPEVPAVLAELHERAIPMSVVSDNWIGLEAVFDGLGIVRYFAGLVISEAMGCRKPDPRMYAEGSRLLGLRPPECLFVDDDPELVAAAERLGYRGVAMCRDGVPPPGGRVVRSLAEVPVIVAESS